MHTLIAIFTHARSAQRAMAMLHGSGLGLDSLSMVSAAAAGGVRVRHANTIATGKSMVTGAVVGGVAALIALRFPMLSSLVGITAFATTASLVGGMFVGLFIGYLVAALLQRGVMLKAEAHNYGLLLQGGNTLVVARVRPAGVRRVQQMLIKAGAESIRGDTPGESLPQPMSRQTNDSTATIHEVGQPTPQPIAHGDHSKPLPVPESAAQTTIP